MDIGKANIIVHLQLVSILSPEVIFTNIEINLIFPQAQKLNFLCVLYCSIKFSKYVLIMTIFRVVSFLWSFAH